MDKFLYENAYKQKGYKYVCGIDEVGRGPLAGPVVTACVVMPYDEMISGVFDSKKVTKKNRERLYDEILSSALSVGISVVNQDTIDKINILNATKLGVKIALEGLKQRPDVIMVDALNNMDTLGIPYDSIIKGDAKCYSIAAASIIAKVYRDRLMKIYDKAYPGYGFADHKGYPTEEHIKAIEKLGPTPIHRMSFAPLKKDN